jgi:hypothetical protein
MDGTMVGVHCYFSVAVAAHAVAIVIHHPQLGMFENVLPRLLEEIHNI